MKLSQNPPISISFNNLSPCPPSLNKGRGSVGKRGASPLSKASSPHDRNIYPYHGEGD